METVTVKVDWENGCDECWKNARAKAIAAGVDLETTVKDTEPFQVPADCYFLCEHNPPEFAPSIFLEPGSFELPAGKSADYWRECERETRALREYERHQESGAEIERKRQETEQAEQELARQHTAFIRALIVMAAIALPIWWFLWQLVSWANRAGFWQWAATIFDGGLK